MSTRLHTLAPLLTLLCMVASSHAAVPSFEKNIQPFLNAHCVQCHNDKTQKGDFRLDVLSKDVGLKDTSHWAEVIEKISSGEMPPKAQKKRPTAEESAVIVEWLSARIKEGEAARMARRDRVSYNRLTRDEYVNTVRDLIGVHYDATDPGGLIEDPQWHGFERIGSVLTLSATHVEKYITAAEIVLAEAYPENKPVYAEAFKKLVTLDPVHHAPHYQRLEKKGLTDKARFPLWGGDIYRGSNPFEGKNPKYGGAGIYEVTYTLSGLKAEDKPAPRLQIYAVDLDRVLFEQDVLAPEGKPTTVTFRAHFPSHRGVPNIHIINSIGGLNLTHRSARHERMPFISLAEGGGPPWQMKLAGEDGEPLQSFLILDSVAMRGPIITEQEQRWRDAYMPAEQGNMEQVRKGLEAMAKRAFR
ncbi:MAG: DUF1587 domain-containing protein, partial [Alphaproteobacteria bacterium]|nr:DUF1587 domain-containing protein [Alphaproteobacteria bacterium]